MCLCSKFEKYWPFRPVHDLNKDKKQICTHTNTGRNLTYHFSRTEIFRVHLHMYHPRLLATANLLLILSIPSAKTQILAGRNIFPQQLEDFSCPFVCLPDYFCSVCFFNVSCRQNMSPVVLFSNQHSGHCVTVTFTNMSASCRTQEGGEGEVRQRRRLRCGTEWEQEMYTI